jgi:hypothetical protein
MKLKLNRWLDKGPAHTNQYFSGLTKASKRHEGLYIEKKVLVHDSPPHPVYVSKRRGKKICGWP